MSPGRRLVAFCGGAAIITTVLLGYRMAAAGQPVHEVQIVASRYAFEPAIVQLAAGESVRLVVRSKDGTHGFAIPKLKIDLHLPTSGEPSTTEFIAPPAGDYEIACSEFCGRGHGQMKAALVTVSAIKTGY
jgi:heme/copper-type cytochrome/quinol oxidase subunit 2